LFVFGFQGKEQLRMHWQDYSLFSFQRHPLNFFAVEVNFVPVKRDSIRSAKPSPSQQ